ncbi:TorD/DmsD family molecular chaperone [Raoultibacter phocaeensis]|uniref:TorD/DmsD family molecular chaperone n=1 Tax=Raoultibacter phocaeensis TaxID=2479841 RepID=UPI001119ECD4|nr:molecular chaperone TorD family protein [Raoultibacter phocaeensis]
MDSELRLSSETAQAYCVLCEFCSLLFTENPDQETLDRLIDQRELLREEPFSSVAPEDAAKLFDILAEADVRGRDGFATGVKRDYTYLFHMISTSHTSPYESVYRTDDRTMFGPTTLEVRKAYHAHGVQVPKQGNTPDDHIGYEFSFLAHLLGVVAEEGAGSEASGDAESGADGSCEGATAAADGEAARALSDARAFLSDHLLVFAPVYLENVRTQAKEPFYRSVAGIAQASIDSLAHALGAQATEAIDEASYLLAE